MDVERKVSSMESSFMMENMQFDDACRKRIRNIYEEKISVADALAELNRKYSVSSRKK